MTIERKHVGTRLSQLVIHGDTIYLAGLVARDPVPEDPAGQPTQDGERESQRHGYLTPLQDSRTSRGPSDRNR